MKELILDNVELRQKLQDTMPKNGAAILRSTVLENRFPLQYFINPRQILAAACDLAEVVISDRYGLANVYILAVTSDNPIQLANSLGAIGAVSYINKLRLVYDKKPDDLKYLGDKYSLVIEDFKKLLLEEPKGSTLCEAFASHMIEEAMRKGTGKASSVVAEWTNRVKEVNQNPDDNFLSSLVEGYFLTVLNTGFGSDPIKDEISTEFLTGSCPIFQETERLLSSHPEYFDRIFGDKSSFWDNNERLKLFPDLKYIANTIIRNRIRMIRAGIGFADSKLTRTIENLYDTASKDISNKEAQKKAADAEKAEWETTQCEFELKWRLFTIEYEKKNGSLNTPPTPSQSVDLLTGGIDILHEAILTNFTENQLRAGLETIIPKFWPSRDLDFILTQVLSEYDYDPVSGNPVLTISGEKALAQLIFLPTKLRSLVLGSDIKISPEQQKAMSKILRSFARATHPDVTGDRFPNSDKIDFANVEGFIKIANGLYSSHMK